MLRIEGLTKRYGATTAVDDLSLEVPAGQMVGIVGRSGAGKSTLLRIVNRLVEPTDGRFSYDGTEITTLKGLALRRWRASAAMIFQQFNLVDRLDVLTNVLIGRLVHHGRLTSALKRFSEEERALAADALDRLALLPQALQRAATLSGGQQQRVAIARALVQNPRLLLADEPIASLDPANAEAVMRALRTINRDDGITVLVNLHHLDAARTYCDRVVGMRAGKLVFDGAPSALTAAAAAELYGSREMSEGKPSNAMPAPTPVPEEGLSGRAIAAA